MSFSVVDLGQAYQNMYRICHAILFCFLLQLKGNKRIIASDNYGSFATQL